MLRPTVSPEHLSGLTGVQESHSGMSSSVVSTPKQFLSSNMSRPRIATTCMQLSSSFSSTQAYVPTLLNIFPTTLYKCYAKHGHDATTRNIHSPEPKRQQRCCRKLGSSKNRGRAKRGPKILVYIYIYRHIRNLI